MRRGTAAQWTAANPVLASGEPGFETDTGKTKIGNGTAAWTALPYVTDTDDPSATPGLSLTPLVVPTVGLIQATSAAPGVRSGLAPTTFPDGQGFVNERIVTGIAGTKDEYTIVTATDVATLTTLHGGATTPWDGIVEDIPTGEAFTVTVLSVNSGTATLLRPLPRTVTNGRLASRIDNIGGQHLTLMGYRALAQHIARFNPSVATRGGILDGQWDTRPPAYFTNWAKNAAMIAYGEVNSAAPVVRTYITVQASANAYIANGRVTRVNTTNGGVQIGTHLSGHGGIATFRPGRRPVIIEVPTCMYRDNSDTLMQQLRVVATTDTGYVIYDKTIDGALYIHRIPVSQADMVTIEVTNTSNAIAYIHVGQMTMREAGVGTRLNTRKMLLFGDSWSQYSDKELGKALGRELKTTVVVYGKGGTTTDWGHAWFDVALDSAGPDLDTVVLLFGTNDLNNNQNTTMLIPDGSTVAMWPNGLTAAQAKVRWAEQMRRLIARVQERGIRPVVMVPGSVNITSQFPGHCYFEQPRLIGWTPSPTELTDTTAYLNTVGKTAGAEVKVGTATFTASGPLAADAWRDPYGEALLPLQRATYQLADYRVDTVVMGTDTNGDGYTDGLTFQDNGTITDDTYTPSLVGGFQRLVSTWVAPSNGQRRLRMNATCTAGKEYLVIWDIINATASQNLDNSYCDVTGSAVVLNASNASIAIDGAGAGRVYYRATANATAAKYTSISRLRSNGTSHTMDVRKAFFVDLTALFAVAPNIASMSTADIVQFCLDIA